MTISSTATYEWEKGALWRVDRRNKKGKQLRKGSPPKQMYDPSLTLLQTRGRKWGNPSEMNFQELIWVTKTT